MESQSIGYHEAPQALNAALFELLPDAYLVLDVHHRVLTCNRRYLEMTGQQSADLVGQSIFALNQWGSTSQRERREQWLSSVLENLREGQRVTSGYFRYDMLGLRSSDGAQVIPHYWQVKATLSRVVAGQPPVIVMCINDVTNEAKQLETGQRDRAALRSQVALRQVVAQKAEKRADNMDAFVSAVSHELRSPLSAIASWTQLLQGTTDADKAAKAAAVIERNTRQLTHMVDDLLDTGAIINGKLSVALSPVDLGVLASLVTEDIRLNAQSKGIQLEIGALSSCMVLGDEKRLKQIVWNLLSNALKFSEAGTISVRVWHEVSEYPQVPQVPQVPQSSKTHEAGSIVLQVADTGKGVAPEIIGTIFERFRQQSVADSGRAGGLGLGLWLVKNLVELHGGSVAAESAGVNLGATFTVRLPAPHHPHS